MSLRPLAAVLVMGWVTAGPAAAQTPTPGATIQIARAAGPIHIDGHLTDEGWRTAAAVRTWYEISPGDNTPPPVETTAYLTYDDRFLYVALDFKDPDPSDIRAPLGDHDDINGISTDFGGIFIDALNTRRTAIEFFVTARNVQYDAVMDDATGENAAPDFFWDSAATITADGWTAEMRIPFSTLRYKPADPQQWGIILFRNYPRRFRHQILSAPMPRGGNCTICRANTLTGLAGLPGGGHLVAAPYASASQTATPRGGTPGAPLANGSVTGRIGLDVKFTPNANNAIDVTLQPDFSQIESDTAQISANERFALFFPEKRPFFLEGVDLFQTPIEAVYTRTITSPTWGGRVTGKAAGVRYTALVTEDGGGGTVILPGSNGSASAPQDFHSIVLVGRVKREIGRSFIGALLTDREATDGGAHNRVFGPDFEWRPSGADVFSGQFLYGETITPARPDLAAEWTGDDLTGRAIKGSWTHNTRHLDWFGQYSDFSDGFRADTGFIPQVGYRDFLGNTGWTVHPKRIVSRLRAFVGAQYQVDAAGEVITKGIEPGVGMDTLWNGFVQVRVNDDHSRAGAKVIGRRMVNYTLQFSPSRRVAYVALRATTGGDIDFDNARPASGLTLNLQATLRPTDHLAIDLVENTRSLDVKESGSRQRLFKQRVSRVKGTYTFSSRMFVRLIGQYVDTTREPALYTFAVDRRSGDFNGSALFAYKVNWQSVLFVGFGDDRELADTGRLRPSGRQFFVKLSYAFQR